MGTYVYNDEGRCATKPGDIAVARAIGTYPNIPECGDADPDYSRLDTFGEDGAHRMYYSGPLGMVEVSMADGIYKVQRYTYAEDGALVYGEVVYSHDMRMPSPPLGRVR